MVFVASGISVPVILHGGDFLLYKFSGRAQLAGSALSNPATCGRPLNAELIVVRAGGARVGQLAPAPTSAGIISSETAPRVTVLPASMYWPVSQIVTGRRDWVSRR